MNVYLISVLLGIVEGLTEFLPVSSTAHLRIAEAMMNIPMDDAYWKMYTIVIQAGAILALCLLFLGRITEFIRTFPSGESGDRNIWNHPVSLTFFAFVATSIPALALNHWSQQHLGSLSVIAWALLLGGIVMWIIDAWSIRQDATTRDVEEMSLFQAVWIGICQTTSAVFPGTSRSMSTIAAGQIVGLSRPAALEFSFLVSIPTMLAATGYSLVKELHPSKAVITVGETIQTSQVAHVVMNSERWVVLIIGFVVSFIVALGVVEWFLHWVRRHGLILFAIYRIILGGALLIWGTKFIGS